LRARVANLEGALNAAIARGAALEHENAALRWRVSELEAEADGQEGA
jgi:BMFP domain-containing protein YqiC